MCFKRQDRENLFLAIICKILFWICWTSKVNSLTVHRVTVPAYSAKGDSVELGCQYDLEGDPLYSVKWYKGFREFFRHVPGEVPDKQVFSIPGVNVDFSRSTASRVILRDVSRSSSGNYKCEVSAEAPFFHTDSGAGELLVADLPADVPHLSGIWPVYYVGDPLHANCTSSKSKPAASLSWYINGRKADQSYLVDYAPESDTEGLETSTLGLRFLVKPRHLHHGELRLRCTATIASVYFKQNTAKARGRLTSRPTPFRERHESSAKGIYMGLWTHLQMLYLGVLCIHFLLKKER